MPNAKWIEKLQEVKYDQNTKNAVQAYKYLLDNFGQLGTLEYQRKYQNFFQLKRRKAEWKTQYFNFLQSLVTKYKDKKPQVEDFETELKVFYDLQKEHKFAKVRVEASFVSKALHMINTDLPIWDANIRQTLLGLKTDPMGRIKDVAKKAEKAGTLYKATETAIQKAIQNEKQIIKEFRAAFPNEEKSLSDVKIIDFYYWVSYTLKPKKK